MPKPYISSVTYDSANCSVLVHGRGLTQGAWAIHPADPNGVPLETVNSGPDGRSAEAFLLGPLPPGEYVISVTTPAGDALEPFDTGADDAA